MISRPPRVVVLVGASRVEEGLRMASALPLADSDVDVVLLGDRLPDTEAVATHLETINEVEVPVWATFADPRVSTVSRSELAVRLMEYDHVLTF